MPYQQNDKNIPNLQIRNSGMLLSTILFYSLNFYYSYRIHLAPFGPIKP